MFVSMDFCTYKYCAFVIVSGLQHMCVHTIGSGDSSCWCAMFLQCMVQFCVMVWYVHNTHTYVTEWPNYVKRSMIIGLSVVANAHWSLTRSTIIGPAVFANACPSVITDKCVDSLVPASFPGSMGTRKRKHDFICRHGYHNPSIAWQCKVI